MPTLFAVTLTFYLLLSWFFIPKVMAESLKSMHFPGHRTFVNNFKKKLEKERPYKGDDFPSDPMIIKSFNKYLTKKSRIYFAGINIVGRYHSHDGTPYIVICTGVKPPPFDITIERNVHARQWPGLNHYWDGGTWRLATRLDCSSFDILRLDTGVWIMRTWEHLDGEQLLVIEK